jgi:hypothetical protein
MSLIDPGSGEWQSNLNRLYSISTHGEATLTEAELDKHLDAAEKSPKEIAAAVSGLTRKRDGT